MTTRLVECIPNFSEARRFDVVEKILESIKSVSNITVLDQHSDIDHNRTVVTFIGPPDEVEEAAFKSITTASELIDLDRHTGSHPRMGATDVVPFVPISGISMDECITLARHLGERVGRELSIPVYLYENASLIPDRKNLEIIRKGGYELLKDAIKTDLSRKPDYGPSELSPAGATAIGARNPLIAFNVYLDTDDIEKAKFIAKRIRESSGGLAHVKALGMLVQGLAQVSMNLTNFEETSILLVFNSIKFLASKLNIKVHHSELVGLVPQAAILNSATEYLRLTGFDQSQILENRVEQQEKANRSSNDFAFLDSLASKDPTPGGGSAAAYAGAMSAALISMAAQLTLGKKKYASVDAQMHEILKQAEKLRALLSAQVDKDARAFEQVMSAFRLPRDTPESDHTRMEAIERATQSAATIPLQVAQWSLSLLSLAERCVAIGNINTASDAGSAGNLAIASIRSALLNVRINLADLTDKHFIDSINSQVDQIESQLDKQEQKLYSTLKAINGL